MATEIGIAEARTGEGATVLVHYAFDGPDHVRQGDPDVANFPQIADYDDEGYARDFEWLRVARTPGTQMWVNALPVGQGLSAITAEVIGGTPGRVSGVVSFTLPPATAGGPNRELPIPVTVVAGVMNDLTAAETQAATRHPMIPNGIRGPIDFLTFNMATA